MVEKINLSELSDDQAVAMRTIKASNKVCVLKGVTGSGKTQIYFHIILDNMKKNLQSLVLIPEIGLSSQIVQRFEKQFGFSPFIWNSSVSNTKKQKIFMEILSQKNPYVVVGTRSALMLPYKNLGLIIVDEEHDQSYKQENGVLYNARDVAVLKSHIFLTKIILGSATPSIETAYNISIGKYEMITLDKRFGNADFPQIIPIDIRKRYHQNSLSKDIKKVQKIDWISQKLENAIKEAIIKKEQVILFLNKRGYAQSIICSNCGYVFTCKNCSSFLVMHKIKKRLECHHCNFISSIKDNCIECNSDLIFPYGSGVEMIAEEASNKFPYARIEIITREESSSIKKMKSLLDKMEKGEIDILVGTQIITKGYHFRKLTVIGVIDSDVRIYYGDLKAKERIFQLLYQLVGRAGREDLKGVVYLQTFNPENEMIKLLQEYKFDDFIKDEIFSRIQDKMPPITKMTSLLITSKKEIKAQVKAKEIFNIIHKELSKFDVRVLGPIQAFLSKINSEYRYRIVIISPKLFNLGKFLNYLIQEHSKNKISIKVDVDPYTLN